MKRTPPIEEKVRFTCCGKNWSTDASHYDKFSHPGCAKVWWALRPQRFGPLEAVLWPGNAEMARCAAIANQREAA